MAHIEDYIIKRMKRTPTRKSQENGTICAYKNKRCSPRTCNIYTESEEYGPCVDRARTAPEIGTIRALCELWKRSRNGERLPGAKKRARLLAKLYAKEAARRSRLHIFD